MIAVDTNVLVAAHRREAVDHHVAARVLTSLAEGRRPWGIPVFCVGEFVRIVTHPRVFAPPSPVSVAMAFVDELVASPTARVLLPSERYLHVLGDLLQRTAWHGNRVFDAQIAAICIDNGASQILSNDRDFDAIDGLSRVSPERLEA